MLKYISMKENYSKVRLQVVKLFLSAILTSMLFPCYAQLNPSQSIYYQNRYLYNPATAGMNDVLNINTNYRKQWVEIPGAPVAAMFTADKQVADRVGLGLNINDDQAGLIRQTRIMGTYAYHLPIGETEQFHFGLSLGVDNSRLNTKNAIADLTDEQIAAYNVLKPYVDGDFGVAYTDNRLYIGAAVPNLKSAFFKSADYRFDADRMLFITMASYKIPVVSDNDDFVLEPIGGFRMVKGYDNIVDFGANFFMNKYGLYMQSIYHTSQSIGVGAGLDLDDYALSFSYNIETGRMHNYTNGAFELGLKLKLFGK